MTRQVHAVLQGTLIGPVWDGDMCTKEISQRLPYRRRGQLVHALAHACNDGDFQWCKLDSGSVIEVTLACTTGRKIFKTTKIFGITEFIAAAPFIYNGEKA